MLFPVEVYSKTRNFISLHLHHACFEGGRESPHPVPIALPPHPHPKPRGPGPRGGRLWRHLAAAPGAGGGAALAAGGAGAAVGALAQEVADLGAETGPGGLAREKANRPDL